MKRILLILIIMVLLVSCATPQTNNPNGENNIVVTPIIPNPVILPLLTNTPTPIPKQSGAGLILDDSSNDNWLKGGLVNVGLWIAVCPNGHEIQYVDKVDMVFCPECNTSYLGSDVKWLDKRMLLGTTKGGDLIIHNGHDEYKEFNLIYRMPDNNWNGFLLAPTDVVKKWVSIYDDSPMLAPKETAGINVTLSLPNKLSTEEDMFINVTAEVADYLYKVKSDKKTIISNHLENIQQSMYPKEELIALLGQLKEGEQKLYTQEELTELLERIKGEKSGFDINREADKLLKYWWDNEKIVNPNIHLLSYLAEKRSVSIGRIEQDCPLSSSLLSEYIDDGKLLIGYLSKDKWEFWISFSEKSTEFIQTEMNSRWLVVMRN